MWVVGGGGGGMSGFPQEFNLVSQLRDRYRDNLSFGITTYLSYVLLIHIVHNYTEKYH